MTTTIGEGNHPPLRPLEGDATCACGHKRHQHTLDSSESRCVAYKIPPPDSRGVSAVQYCGCHKYVSAAQVRP